MPFNQAGDAVVHRLPLAVPMMNRAASQYSDSFLLNCYIEAAADGRKFVVKRPGLSVAYNLGGALNGQGMTYYNNYLFAMASNTLYRVNGSGSNAYSVGAAWSSLGNAAWLARDNFASIVFQNKIFVIGGYNGSIYFSDIWSTLDGTNWNQVVANAPWGKRAAQCCVVFNNRLYIMGGANAGTYYNDVWVTDDGVNWTELTSSAAWTARTEFGVYAYNNGIFIVGGVDSGAGYANDVWFTTDGITWIQTTAAAAFSARALFGYTVFNNLMWVVGGYGGAAINNVYYSADGITWIQSTAAAFGSARYGLNCLDYAGKIWAIAGSTGADIYSSSDGITWSLVTAAPGFSARASFGSVVFRAPASVSSTNAAIMWVMGGFPGAYVNDVWRSNADGSLATSWALTTSGSTNEQFQFASVNNNQYLCFKNTYNIWTLYAGVIAKVTDTNYPQRTVPGIVNLDSTVYVMDQGGVIYGCDLTNPTQWNALNFITAEYESDDGVYIAKHQNYVVALKKNTVEFFYDAGTPIGSPLLPLLNATARIGCASAGSVVSMDNTLIYMAQTFQAGRSIVALNGFVPTPLSNQYVDRLLNADSLSTVFAFSVKIAGHDFYVLTLKSSSITLVCDMATKEWSLWSSNDASTYFQSINYATNNALNYLQHETAGIIYSMLPSVYDDNGMPIYVGGSTDLIDFNSTQRKFCSDITIVGDKYNSTNPVFLAWTDNNYLNYSTPISVDMALLRPRINRGGNFRRRAFSFVHTASQPLRLEALELTILPGDV